MYSFANRIVNRVLSRSVRRHLRHVLPANVTLSVQKFRYLSEMRGGTDGYEPEMTVIRRLVRDGNCVADLGASIGWYTRFLSDLVGPGGLVCSVEPQSDNFAVLDYLRQRLPLSNVKAFSIAVSNVQGRALMVVPRDEVTGEPDSYRTRIAASDCREAPADSFYIRTERLDDLVHRRFDFVKCDVEGHEPEVLAGARCVLAAMPSWMIEIWGHPDCDPRARGTFACMTAAGYSAYVLDRDGMTVRPRMPGEVGIRGNYFFLAGNHIPLLEARV